MNKLEIKQPVSEVVIAENQQKIAKYLEDSKPVTIDELETMRTIEEEIHLDFVKFIASDVVLISGSNLSDINYLRFYIDGQLCFVSKRYNFQYVGAGLYEVLLVNDCERYSEINSIYNEDPSRISVAGVRDNVDFAYYSTDSKIINRVALNGIKYYRKRLNRGGDVYYGCSTICDWDVYHEFGHTSMGEYKLFVFETESDYHVGLIVDKFLYNNLGSLYNLPPIDKQFDKILVVLPQDCTFITEQEYLDNLNKIGLIS